MYTLVAVLVYFVVEDAVPAPPILCILCRLGSSVFVHG